MSRKAYAAEIPFRRDLMAVNWDKTILDLQHLAPILSHSQVINENALAAWFKKWRAREGWGASTMTTLSDQCGDGSPAPVHGPRRPLITPFRLQAWEVEPELNQIRHARNGITRHLEPRLMQLLCYLAANPGRVMSRETLVQELWPRVVVNENSLTRAVSELRKHLREPHSGHCRAVQTIPKRGYRLNATITSLPGGGLEPLAAATFSRRIWYGAAVAACLGLAVGLGLFSRGESSVEPNAPLLADQVVSSNRALMGEVTLSSIDSAQTEFDTMEAPVISTDGSRVAYIARDLNGYTIYLGQLEGDAKPVPVHSSQARLSNLAWSPVGNALLFARHDTVAPAAAYTSEPSQPVLLSLDLETGQLRRLVEGAAPPEPKDAPQGNLTAFTPIGLQLFKAGAAAGLGG